MGCSVDARLLSDPAAVDFLLRVVARRVRRTSDAITDLMSATVSARVAKCLLRQAQQFGQREDDVIRVTLDLTQEQLAQLVGTSRESMNKALSDFADRGWIRLDGDAVVIVESQPLAFQAHLDAARAHRRAAAAHEQAALMLDDSQFTVQQRAAERHRDAAAAHESTVASLRREHPAS